MSLLTDKNIHKIQQAHIKVNKKRETISASALVVGNKIANSIILKYDTIKLPSIPKKTLNKPIFLPLFSGVIKPV